MTELKLILQSMAMYYLLSNLYYSFDHGTLNEIYTLRTKKDQKRIEEMGPLAPHTTQNKEAYDLKYYVYSPFRTNF